MPLLTFRLFVYLVATAYHVVIERVHRLFMSFRCTQFEEIKGQRLLDVLILAWVDPVVEPDQIDCRPGKAYLLILIDSGEPINFVANLGIPSLQPHQKLRVTVH